jgi:hypothetical protein
VIRVTIVDHRQQGIPPAETTRVVCDYCGGECAESLQYAADQGAAIGWHGLSALAAAKFAGWTKRLNGRLQRDACPSCSAGSA